MEEEEEELNPTLRPEPPVNTHTAGLTTLLMSPVLVRKKKCVCVCDTDSGGVEDLQLHI